MLIEALPFLTLVDVAPKALLPRQIDRDPPRDDAEAIALKDLLGRGREDRYFGTKGSVL
jgi:hypothetical protein